MSAHLSLMVQLHLAGLENDPDQPGICSQLLCPAHFPQLLPHFFLPCFGRDETGPPTLPRLPSWLMVGWSLGSLFRTFCTALVFQSASSPRSASPPPPPPAPSPVGQLAKYGLEFKTAAMTAIPSELCKRSPLLLLLVLLELSLDAGFRAFETCQLYLVAAQQPFKANVR